MQFANFIYDLSRSLRPRQWIKNLAVFAAIVFSGDLFNGEKFFPVLFIFFILCTLSSAFYLINDIVDRERDQLHYFKKFRPIASGKIGVRTAFITATILIAAALYGATIVTNETYLLILCILFTCLQLAYSFYLKKQILLDVIAIATGFMMRIFAGSFVVDVSLSSWLILTVAMGALFLAIGKRRLELTLMTHSEAVKHRDILSHYPQVLLDGLTFMMATSTLLTYSLFTFNETKRANKVALDFLPETIAAPKWLMITIPFVIYGIFRYLYIIYEKKQGDSPERVLFNDFPLLTTIVLWFVTVYWAVYVLGK